MTAEILESLAHVARQLHPGNLDRLEIRLANSEATPQSVTMLAMDLPQPDQREALSQLSRQWKSVFPDVKPAEMIAAVQAFRYVARREPHAELCWSGPVNSLQGFRTTAEGYRELISSASRSALIVSFAVGEVESLRASLETIIQRGIHVRFILEDFNVFNQESWRHRFSSLGATVLGNSTIYVWPATARRQREGRIFGSMHVKCLVIDDEAILLTSANWSSAALQDNMELGLIVSGSELAKSVVRHFDHLIAIGILVPLSSFQ